MIHLKIISIPAGDVALSGLHYIPVGTKRKIALLVAHGFSSGKYSMDSMASYLAERGYESVTFDFVGHKLGGSGGEMHKTIMAAENVSSAVAWMRTNLDMEGIVLIGHSMGAAASIQVASWENERSQKNSVPIAGIVSMCMGTEPSRGFDGQIGKTMLKQRQDYVSGAPALQLLQGIDEMALSVREIGTIPALFIAARQDVLVSVHRVEELAAMAAKSRVVTLETTHLDSPIASRSVILQWLNDTITEISS